MINVDQQLIKLLTKNNCNFQFFFKNCALIFMNQLQSECHLDVKYTASSLSRRGRNNARVRLCPSAMSVIGASTSDCN